MYNTVHGYSNVNYPSEWIEDCLKLPLADLRRHADVGRTCGCNDCFICCALAVLKEREAAS